MGWATQVDIYCERLDYGFWAEPLNAVSNAAFIVAALIMWRRSTGVQMAQVLCVILIVIGIGSFLFHTFATYWASVADVVPIFGFILTYLYLVNWDFVGLPQRLAIAMTSAFVPFAAMMLPVFEGLPFFHISDFYWTVPLLLVIYAVFLARRVPEMARGMVIGTLLLCMSITVRSLDMMWCDALSFGTHFLLHGLNAVMLGWMIHIYVSHVVANGSADA